MIFGATSPVWFLGFDLILELIFFLVTGLIAWYAYRIHRLTGYRQYKRWSTGFLFVALAYVVNALTNLFLYFELKENGLMVSTLGELTRIYNVGLLIHMLFFLAGYVILVFVSLRVDDARLSPLLLFLIAVTALASLPFSWVFELATIMLFLYLIILTAKNTRAHRKKTVHSSRCNQLVIIGFSILLLGQLAYLFLPLWSISYVVGHVLELLGYAALIASMTIILRRK